MPPARSLVLILITVAAMATGLWWLASSRPATVVTPELVRDNNRAVGLMGQFDFDAAVSAFEALAAREPRWPGARLNLAVALVNRQGPDDPPRAEQVLRTLLDEPSVARRARYTLGLLLAHEGRDDEALPLLAEVAEGESPDGYAAYFTGQLRLSNDPAAALRSYQEALAREPLLRSAYYGAFLALRRLQREDEAARMLAEFQALESNPQAVVAEFKYTRMGPLSEAMTVDLPAAADSASGATGPRFLDPRALVEDSSAAWRQGGGPRSITVADIDGDGTQDLFVADALVGDAPNAVLLRRSGTFVLDSTHPLARVSDVRAALWADLNDDGRVDVVLCRPSGGTAIWQQDEAGWRDITSGTGVSLAGTDIVDGAVFDADHDGDLDIWLVNASGANELLNNDGDGRFRTIAVGAGVAGDGRPSRGLAVVDLDGDRDADVIVIKAAPPHDVYLNGRAWEYARDASAAELAAAPVTALMPADFDADGEPELYTTGSRGLERWRRDEAGTWRAERLSAATDEDARLAVADTDGDGRLELLATSGGTWAAFDAASTASGWTLAAGAPERSASAGWAVAHLDPQAGPSIVGVADDGIPRLWAPGPGRHGFIALTFTGRDPASDQRRSNVSGLGARVAVRVDSRWTAFDTTRLASGPGQSLQPMTVGLGGAPRADFVALTWSDGVFQTELALEAGRLHRIAETQRQLSSCPVLFAWDGKSFHFVTDLLGTGGIGFFERPGVYAEPLPRENVLLPATAMTPADGVYRLKIAEPMEEITYLDSLALVAYDVPPGWQMALDERKAIQGPEPTGEPIFYREERLPQSVRGASGEDVTTALAEADLRAAGPAAVDPRFIGRAEPWSITMTFAEPIDRGPGRPVLIVDGWVEYPYAQTMFAAWQAGALYEAPTLEARGADGVWREVAREFGYPAGMPRRMAFPLPALPRGTTALRLRTSQEIYWDRVSVAYAEPAPGVVRRVLAMREAVLEADGFAQRTTGPQRTPHYDDRRRQPLGDTRHPRGWYTAFGRVDPLLADEDAAVAILGPGESVTVAYEAPPDAPADGWTRQLVLEARGWCKDMDLYTRDGETVEPLPGAETPARARLHPLFNTRYAAGF